MMRWPTKISALFLILPLVAPAPTFAMPLDPAIAKDQSLSPLVTVQVPHMRPNGSGGGPHNSGSGRRTGGGQRGGGGGYPGGGGYHRGGGDNGAGAVAAGAAIGLLLGAIVATQAQRQQGVDYCMQRYRSYDPRSGTFLGRDGQRYRCP
jgi:BA14K-like protein